MNIIFDLKGTLSLKIDFRELKIDLKKFQSPPKNVLKSLKFVEIRILFSVSTKQSFDCFRVAYLIVGFANLFGFVNVKVHEHCQSVFGQ